MPITVFRALIGAALISSVPAQVTVHVDGSYSGPGDGSATAPYPTVQQGLDHPGLQHYDTVLVAPGVYEEALTVHVATVNLIGAQGPSQTTLLAPPGAAVHLALTGRIDCVVDGFTLVGNGTNIGVEVNWLQFVQVRRSVLREHGTAFQANFDLLVESCTVVDNLVGIEHFGFPHSGGAITYVSDSIFWSNTTDIDGTDLTQSLSTSGTLQGVDPSFHGPGDPHLLAGSPAIDTGNANETDPDGTRRDAGAFAFDPSWPLAEATCRGTLNSTGELSRIYASGSSSVSAGTLIVHGDRLPALEFALLFRGPEAANAPLGQGTLCIGGSLVRMEIQRSDASGALAYSVDLAATSLVAGQTTYLQLWHRDVLAPDFFALSGAVRIELQP